MLHGQRVQALLYFCYIENVLSMMCVYLHGCFQCRLCFYYKIQLTVKFSGEEHSKGSKKKKQLAVVVDV